ncbi:MAG TPA: acVLRF1 family peptidyl-tRNA hydrolase [Nocardioidaceae bacterium]|nr:acVLRF1 family peptidyl-tRNA hydrolase [Nocardioidaceae bacterium]
MSEPRTVLVPAGRVVRWFANFGTRHGPARLTVAGGALHATAEDGALAQASLPFGRPYVGPPDASAYAEAATATVTWGILLVRKGGFAVATVDGTEVTASKVGQRHVQGRTKAGGQSQQRFARRRGNQARQAYEAAAEHAHRVLVRETSDPVQALVCGGDRSAVDAVLADPRLQPLADIRTEPWLAVPDPRRSVLDQAVVDGGSVRIRVTDPG